jgi:hypothetical protein
LFSSRRQRNTFKPVRQELSVVRAVS